MPNNNSDEKYLKALDQIQAGKAIRDHLKHQDFHDHVIDILKIRSDFPPLVMRSLFQCAKFWVVLILTNLVIALFVVKFTSIAEWACSLFFK
jgi:hypothetical protein